MHIAGSFKAGAKKASAMATASVGSEDCTLTFARGNNGTLAESDN